MAVSVLMSPTTPNVTNTNLVYTLSSSLSSNPQFRYVTDIYESGSTNLLVRLTTYPNTYGTVNIDVSRELNDNIDWDNNWESTSSLTAVDSYKTFDLRFGEEYGTSISSSTTIYTGSTSNYLGVFPGHVYSNQGSYNFPSSSYNYGPDSRFAAFTGTENSPVLNTIPTSISPSGLVISLKSQPIGVNDYGTITLLKQNWYLDNFLFGNAYGILIGDTSGRNFFADNIPSPIPQDYTTDTTFTIPVGPANIGGYTLTANPYGLPYTTVQDVLDNDWEGYLVYASVNSQILGSTGIGLGVKFYNPLAPITDSYKDRSYILVANPCNEYTRFAFINKNGVWDYYNIYNPLRRQSQVNRSTYEKPFVSYGNLQASYDITNRGTTQYLTKYNDIYEITTDYIPKDVADWVTELFESPDVYIQSGSDFIPVNILNTQVTWNLDQNRNKLFQYTISFKYANQREPR